MWHGLKIVHNPEIFSHLIHTPTIRSKRSITSFQKKKLLMIYLSVEVTDIFTNISVPF